MHPLGPRAVAAKAEKENIAIGMPLSSFENKSLSVPPTRAIAVEPPIADMKRVTRKASMLGAAACGIWKTVKITAQKMYNPRRPHTYVNISISVISG